MKFRTIHCLKGLKYIAITAMLAAGGVLPTQALPLSHYAAHSRLAEGKWVRVRISETGMHFISDATLRNLGFANPANVRVYGTGGRMVAEALSITMPDDLPPVASARTSKGLVFYAEDHFSWTPDITEPDLPYKHSIHPYSHDSYYFLSDSATDEETATVDMTGAHGEGTDTFDARLVHEQELVHLGESGRNYLGEDFRANKSQTLRFDLPDNAGGDAVFNLRFCTKITSGSGTLALKANGNPVEGKESVMLTSCNTSAYGKFTDVAAQVMTDDKLELGLEFNYSGALFLSCLDYVEVFYRRKMALRNGELSFYGTFPYGSTLTLTGVEETTQIWDITDRGNPMQVKFDREGDTARMRTVTGGYREYVAFTPEKITRTATGAGQVANQDLHGMAAPDMLIITPSVYRDGAEIIANHHSERDGMDVMLLDPQIIYNEFSGGKTDVGAWRKLMKMWHDRGGAPKYVLIMGKPSFDNKGIDTRVKYRPVPIWQSADGLTETASYCSDDYIAMLDDVEPENFRMRRSMIHAAVGRLPVRDAEEAVTTAKKIVKHITEPNLGAWRNKVMLIADDSDNSVHFNQAQTCYGEMRGQGTGANYQYDRLYLDSYPLVKTATGNTYPQATTRMLNNYNEGVALTDYIGHASETGWGHEHLWTWPQIQEMANPNLTFIYAATCRFAPWDEPGLSGGESLLFNPKGGVSGMIVASRTVYISQNGELNKFFSRELFKTDGNGLTRRLGDVYVAAKNNYLNDDNKLRYVFMGDPAMRLNNITHRVSVDLINGIEPETAIEYPVIEGGSRLELTGTVQNPDGTVDNTFNGTVALQLYDAETVIETYGNGDTGRKEIYNDRKTRLAIANTKVRDGRWKATMNVPLEISNNYQPALVTAYAWDDRAREANGYSESLYVYGFSDEQERDTVGPTVDHFYLNRETFKDGDIVNPNPVAFIRMSDPSGINVSEAGVGHRISLRLDTQTPYDDVSQYWTADIDGTGGTVIYGLNDLRPGRHSLTLEAWDNLNNSTRRTIEFQVSTNADPYIVNIGTDCNPATSGVTFNILLDQPNTMMKCDLTVYDLSGRIVWESSMRDNIGTSAKVSTYWNLADKSGARVPRGIYLYKARVETPQGTWSTKTNKLAVTAQ